MEQPVRFQDYITQLREILGLGQSAFASKLGLSRPYVSLMENGRRSPSLKVLFTMRRLYGFSIDRFLDTIDGSTIPE